MAIRFRFNGGKALKESFAENAHLTFEQLVHKTHLETDYAQAPGRWMRYEDFLPAHMPDRDNCLTMLSHSYRPTSWPWSNSP